MKTYTFDIIIEDDEFEDGRQAYHAYCPALPGCHTWGHTYEEAQTNIQEAISLYIEDILEAGEEIPTGATARNAGRVLTSVAISL